MRKIVLLSMGVLACSLVSCTVWGYTIVDGQYEYGTLRLYDNETLLVTGGGHTELKPLIPAMLKCRQLLRPCRWMWAESTVCISGKTARWSTMEEKRAGFTFIIMLGRFFEVVVSCISTVISVPLAATIRLLIGISI